MTNAQNIIFIKKFQELIQIKLCKPYMAGDQETNFLQAPMLKKA